MDGRLRALSTKDGKTLWEFDTARDFETRNGIKANGGSMSNARPTIVHGMLLVNSGYSHHRGGISRKVRFVFFGGFTVVAGYGPALFLCYSKKRGRICPLS